MAIQLHHVARTELENVSERHFATAKPKCRLKFHIEQQLDSGPMRNGPMKVDSFLDNFAG